MFSWNYYHVKCGRTRSEQRLRKPTLQGSPGPWPPASFIFLNHQQKDFEKNDGEWSEKLENRKKKKKRKRKKKGGGGGGNGECVCGGGVAGGGGGGGTAGGGRSMRVYIRTLNQV